MEEYTTVDKYSSYLIQNLLNIKKKRILSEVTIDVETNLIVVKYNDVTYMVSNLIEYKNLIDQLSNEFRIVLKYFPKRTNDLQNSYIILK